MCSLTCKIEQIKILIKRALHLSLIASNTCSCFECSGTAEFLFNITICELIKIEFSGQLLNEFHTSNCQLVSFLIHEFHSPCTCINLY